MKGTQLASDIKFFLDYSKWIEEENRPETWKDAVKRIMDMHRNNPKFQKAFKNSRFIELFDLADRLYQDKVLLGSNRALQFGGAPIMKHNSKMYNCLGSNCDRVEFFQEAMYWLMSGCGVGYSVQYRHINQLPDIAPRTKGVKIFTPTDDIEGWSDCFGVLMSSYFTGEVTFPEYQGYEVQYDLSRIREKGAKISGGFKAPGPEGLRKQLEKATALLNSVIAKSNRLLPIHCYDIVCFEADAVLSGGVRRSATICLFSKEDKLMMEAKKYENFNPSQGINPQRARSNNSAVYVRSEITREEFTYAMQCAKDFGDPGFYLVDDPDQATNPCVEIGFWPYTKDGISGWQGCNLTTANGGKLTTRQKFLEACIGIAVLGTLQATYTDFKYVNKSSKEIFEQEALLGCSITGWMNNPDVLLDEKNMRDGAQLILDINKELADMLGIKPCARATCVKPEGNTSVLLETASGCHGEEGELYFRLMQINKESEIAKILMGKAPFLIEESVWSSSKTDIVAYIPVETKKGSIFKKDLIGVKQLEIVKKIQQNWVEYGTRKEACMKPFLRHNVSNTVQVEDWEEVGDFIFNNKEYFSGVSFLGTMGYRAFKQMPFTIIFKPEQMLEKYGDALIFASGLIVDGLHEFDNDLYDACQAVVDKNFKLSGNRRDVLCKKDWIRRAKQFARRYFKGNLEEMVNCLKDVHLYHKWVEINRELKVIDFSKENLKPVYVEADTLGSIACVGGQCEIPYMVKDKSAKVN